jgi:hypothetical protein
VLCNPVATPHYFILQRVCKQIYTLLKVPQIPHPDQRISDVFHTLVRLSCLSSARQSRNTHACLFSISGGSGFCNHVSHAKCGIEPHRPGILVPFVSVVCFRSRFLRRLGALGCRCGGAHWCPPEAPDPPWPERTPIAATQPHRSPEPRTSCWSATPSLPFLHNVSVSHMVSSEEHADVTDGVAKVLNNLVTLLSIK